MKVELQDGILSVKAETIADVKKILALGEKPIIKAVKKIPAKKSKKYLSQTDRTMIFEGFRKGTSQSELGKAYGVSGSRISQIVSEMQKKNRTKVSEMLPEADKPFESESGMTRDEIVQ